MTVLSSLQQNDDTTTHGSTIDGGNWKDIAWKEYDYHAGDGAHAKVPAVEAIVSLFGQNDDDDEWNDDMEFRFKGLNHTIYIRGESQAGNTKVFQSTGLAAWSSGDELGNYLVNAGSRYIRGKRVLELGSGTGIGGIIAHHVGASSVVWTDGDSDALENLRHNVAKNVQDTNYTSSRILQCCPQLVWGEGLKKFRKEYGTFDCILAADCIYMNKCLEPFWATVDSLLMANETDHVQDFVLVYVNTCVSQAPFQSVEAVGHRFGFVECKTASTESIHIFQRAKKEAS
jgi:16S rRNA G966 N2-methylase RsmD